MSLEENKELVRRLSMELISQGRLAAADEVVSENYINHNPVPGQVPGREGFKQSLARLRTAFPDLKETIEAIVAEDDLVVVRTTRTATHQGDFLGIPATHRAVTVPTMYMAKISDGKITDIWLNWDLMGLVQQLNAGMA